MNAPAVSVIVPVHNGGALLRQTLASALGQSLGNIEVIAVDDGSTDDSLALLDSIALADSRLHIFSQHRAGPSAARNAGARLARAPLLAFLDADDLWHPEKLARHAALHQARPEVAASFARVAFLPAEAASMAAAHTFSHLPRCPLRVIDVINENPACTTSNMVVTRRWFQACHGFDEIMSHAEDKDLLARILRAGGLVQPLEAVLVGYRLSPQGLSLDLEGMLHGWRELARRFLSPREMAASEAVYRRFLARRALRGDIGRWVALRHVAAGLACHAPSFLNPPRRALPTIGGALLAPCMPVHMRRRLFA